MHVTHSSRVGRSQGDKIFIISARQTNMCLSWMLAFIVRRTVICSLESSSSSSFLSSIRLCAPFCFITKWSQKIEMCTEKLHNLQVSSLMFTPMPNWTLSSVNVFVFFIIILFHVEIHFKSMDTSVCQIVIISLGIVRVCAQTTQIAHATHIPPTLPPKNEKKKKSREKVHFSLIFKLDLQNNYPPDANGNP